MSSNIENNCNCNCNNYCNKLKIRRTEMKCTKCGVNIVKKIGSMKMCKMCNSLKSKEYYKKREITLDAVKIHVMEEKSAFIEKRTR